MQKRMEAEKNIQLAHDDLWTSPDGPLKVLTSGTCRGLSRNSQGTNTKTDDLMKILLCRSNSPCITYLFLFFTGKTNIQKFGDVDILVTSMTPSCGMSWKPNDRTF